jgi:hypothetical protein
MSPMAAQILDLVTQRRAVSFAELSREIDGFSGDFELGYRDHNIVLWHRASEEADLALQHLTDAGAIHAVPTTAFVYLIDGMAIRLPIARQVRRYKKPHWLPVVFNPGPERKRKGS